MKKVLIPKSNLKDVMLEKKYKDMIEVIPTETLSDVLENILISGSKKDTLIEKMKNIGSKVVEKVPKTSINNPTTN